MRQCSGKHVKKAITPLGTITKILQIVLFHAKTFFSMQLSEQCIDRQFHFQHVMLAHLPCNSFTCLQQADNHKSLHTVNTMHEMEITQILNISKSHSYDSLTCYFAQAY